VRLFKILNVENIKVRSSSILSTKPRPTRVTVASPSGREGRTITVSSRSILARGRKSRTRTRGTTTTPRRARVKKSPPLRPRPAPIPRGTAPTFVTNLIPFQSQARSARQPLIFESFSPERRRGKARGRGVEVRPERRASSFTPRGRRLDDELGSDFDVLNFFG